MAIYSPQLCYYVYAYLRTDGTPYYIGKGKDKRAFAKEHNVKVPHKSRIVFCETYLTELGTFALERRLIRWYGRKDNGTGILRNLTDGGEGASGKDNPMFGKTHTEAARKKISDTHKGKKKPQRTAETCRKLAEANRKPCSEEKKAKISAANKGKIRTQETLAKLKARSAKLKGKPRFITEEHREDIKAANRKRSENKSVACHVALFD